MSDYIKPTLRPDELVSIGQCFIRAQRALEFAESALVEVVTAGLPGPETLAAAAVRAEIGRGWVELGTALRGAR